MAKVVVGVRMAAEIRDEFMKWAAEDRRSLGNYLEALFMQERERRLNGEVTLASLDRRFDQVMDELADLKVKKKKVKDEVYDTSGKKLSAYDVDTKGLIPHELWVEWISYLHSIGVHCNYVFANVEFAKLERIAEDDWDCEQLIRFLMNDGARKIFLPFTWTNTEKRKQR